MKDHNIARMYFSQFIRQFIHQQNITFIKSGLHADIHHSHPGEYRINGKIKTNASNNVCMISMSAAAQNGFLLRLGPAFLVPELAIVQQIR